MGHLRVTTAGVAPRSTRKRATIIAGDQVITLPITSPEVEHTDNASEWVEITRPGQRPLFRRANEKLRGMRFDVIFRRDDGGPVDGELRKLREFANNPHGPLTVAYGPLEAGQWRLVDFPITSEHRQAGTNAITLARVTLVFVEAWFDPARPNAVRKPSSAPAPAPAAQQQRQHTVASGDTLSKIAARYCGDANAWPRIAEANGIRNPNLIQPGQRLIVPC
jgi:hypothetical protein